MPCRCTACRVAKTFLTCRHVQHGPVQTLRSRGSPGRRTPPGRRRAGNRRRPPGTRYLAHDPRPFPYRYAKGEPRNQPNTTAGFRCWLRRWIGTGRRGVPIARRNKHSATTDELCMRPVHSVARQRVSPPTTPYDSARGKLRAPTPRESARGKCLAARPQAPPCALAAKRQIRDTATVALLPCPRQLPPPRRRQPPRSRTSPATTPVGLKGCLRSRTRPSRAPAGLMRGRTTPQRALNTASTPGPKPP